MSDCPACGTPFKRPDDRHCDVCGTQPGSTSPVAPPDPSSERQPDPLIGAKIGGCQIDKMIGRGGMSTVYRAKQPSLDRDVAIKVFRPELTEDPSTLTRFRQEARILAQFDTNHVVRVFDAGFDNALGLHFLQMELIVGGDLEDYARLQRGGILSIDEAVKFLRQAAQGLAEAQSVGVVHRDIKPRNLLLDGSSRLKIADFGISKFLGSDLGLTSPSPLGTPLYMSPEQCRSEEISFKSDMYSLGASFFHLVTGAPAARGSAIVDVLRFKDTAPCLDPQEARPDLDIDVRFNSIIRRMTALDAADRYDSFEEVVRACEEIEGDAPAAASARAIRPAAPSDSEPQSRARGLWVVAIVVLLLAGAGVAWSGGSSPLQWLEKLYVGTGQLLTDIDYGMILQWIGFAVVAAAAIYLGTRFVRRSRTQTSRNRGPVDNPPQDTRKSVPAPEPVDPPPASAPRPSPPPDPAPKAPDSVPPPDLDLGHTMAAMPSPSMLRDMASAQGGMGAAGDRTMYLPAPDTGVPLPRLAVAVTIVQSPDLARVGEKIHIDKSPFRIGRSRNADLAILGDEGISRLHAQILSSDKSFLIQDAGSHNGTFVNGHRLNSDSKEVLFFGSTIALANSVLSFNAELPTIPDLTEQLLDGRYLLRERLHSSVKAATYAAEDQRLRRALAIKLLSPVLASYSHYEDAFRRQAESAARLKHPHICRILDFGEGRVEGDGTRDKFCYLCMELLLGGDLLGKIDDELSLDHIVRCLNDLASALDYAHEAGVVHGGIKPSCIVFDEAGNVHLTDFALARSCSDTSHRPLLGAPAFLAPEQWDGQKSEPATDQYALAVVAYMMISGSRPYEGQENPKVRRKNYKRSPIPAHEEARRAGREEVPAEVSKVLERALSIDPADRYSTVMAFANELQQSLSDKGQREPRVFLSYSRRPNAGWAQLFAQKLRSEFEIDVFLDVARRDSAVEFPERIRREIEGCDVFVCLLDKETLASRWVCEEVRLADGFDRPCVPVFYEDFEPSQHAGNSGPHVDRLLRFDGVHLLDKKNIHVDHTIKELADAIRQTLAT